MSDNMEKNVENETVVEETVETVVEETVDVEVVTEGEVVAEDVFVEETTEKRYPSYRERKRLKEEERKRKKEEEQKIMSDIIMAQAELDALKREHGIQDEEKGIKKAITNFFDRKDNREKVLLNKKKYIWLAVLLGWVGGHRFYSKQYLLGFIYLVLFWSGIPIAMTIVDLMVIIPMKPDEDGNVLI